MSSEERREADAGAEEPVLTRCEVATADGLRLSAFDSGTAQGRVALLVNAYGVPMAALEPLARALSVRYRVISWEARVLPGPSLGSDTACSVAAHQADALAVLSQFGVREVDVAFGWCTGGRVVLRMLAASPGIVRAAVLMNGEYRFESVPRTAYQQDVRGVFDNIVADPSRAAQYAIMMQKLAIRRRQSGSRFLNQSDPRLNALTSAPYRTAESLLRYVAMHRAIDEGADDLALARTVDAPVVVMTCKEDRITHPQASRMLAGALPRATFLELDGDHYLVVLQPQVVVDAAEASMACSR